MLRAELEKAKAASWKKDIKVLLMQARDDIIVLTQEKQQLTQGKQRVEKELAAMRLSVALQYDTAGTVEAPAATMYVNPAVGEVAAESRSQSSQFDVSPSMSVSQEPEVNRCDWPMLRRGLCCRGASVRRQRGLGVEDYLKFL